MPRCLLLVLFSLLGARVARAQAPALGPEFRVNTYTSLDQSRPSVAMDPSGNFVVVWESIAQDGSGSGIFGQRYDGGGAPLGSEFRINTYTSASQTEPSAAMDASGGFVVVWQGPLQDGSGSGIFAQRFDDAGSPLGAEFRVNTSTPGDQNHADVAVDHEGNFVVVWQSDSDGQGYPEVVGQRFDATGSPTGAEFVVSGLPGYAGATGPAVATGGDGEFVVAWRYEFYYHRVVYVRHYLSSGVPACWGVEVGASGAAPDVEMAPSGDYVVAFTLGGGIMARRFAFCGAIGDPFRLNGGAVNEGTTPSLAGDESGDFIVTWDSPSDESGTGIFARRVSAWGEPLDSEFLVNAFTPSFQAEPAIAMNGSGRWILAWDSVGQDLSARGVYARRPAAAAPMVLSVDRGPAGGSASNLNGLLEAGETVRVEPTWRNALSSELDLAGTASSLSGPPGPIYEIADGSADYGSIPAGGSGSCADATGDCFEVSITGPRAADHWDALLEESLSAGDIQAWTLHVAESFGDVPTSHMFYADAENLFHNGVTDGCAAGSYCPSDPVQRDQMAVFLLKARHGGSYLPPSCAGVFADVPCPSPFADWIEHLLGEGITGGCDPTHSCPSSLVTRAQMAVFMLKAKYGPGFVPPACNEVFPDVPCTSPFAAWIERLFHEGITAGCGGANYCPNGFSTRGQMAVFLVKTFGLRIYGP